jgi:hypothetical protein
MIYFYFLVVLEIELRVSACEAGALLLESLCQTDFFRKLLKPDFFTILFPALQTMPGPLQKLGPVIGWMQVVLHRPACREGSQGSASVCHVPSGGNLLSSSARPQSGLFLSSCCLSWVIILESKFRFCSSL